MQKEEISKEFYEIEAKRNKAKKELEIASNQKEEANKKIKEYELQKNTIENEIRMKQSRQSFLIETEKEKEGYTKSVKLLLKECETNPELKKGVEGVLANLIEVPENLETAIEMCLGLSLQNIVTNTETDAKKLVEYLRKNNIGRASFLPITSVKGKKIDKIKGKEDGVIGIASDLVKYNKKHEQIVLNLLGKTVIVDNMDTAIRLAKQNSYMFRIVTLQGDVINASGSITGGAVAKKTVNILGRSKEIEKLGKEIGKVQEKLQDISNKKIEHEKAMQSIFENAEVLEKQLQEDEISYAMQKQKMEGLEETIKKLEVRLQKLKDEKLQLEENKKNSIEQREQIQVEIESLNAENEKLTQMINEYAELNRDDQKYIDDLNFDITNLKISVSSFDESESSIEEIKERIAQEKEANQKTIANKEEQIEQIKQENSNLEQSIQEIKDKIEAIKEDVKNSSSKIESLKLDRKEKNEKLVVLEDEITEKFSVIEDLRAQLVKLEVKKTKVEEEITQIINKLWEEYELTPNSITEYEKPTNIQNTKKKVNELRAEMKDLGSVNLASIEEYKNLKERYDFMNEQRLDLESTMAKLRKIVTEMTQIMKEQFKLKFKEINKNFGQVFAELFGGGKAEVTLEDEKNILECGIEITAQPPGKKLQNMMLLSGGEKALTAIALLFAILKINPAPFCVLDEIEAALDDVNVYRYADYLKKFAKDTQFLVITHRKGTMEAADTVYGVTMEENGISKLLSMKLKT